MGVRAVRWMAELLLRGDVRRLPREDSNHVLLRETETFRKKCAMLPLSGSLGARSSFQNPARAGGDPVLVPSLVWRVCFLSFSGRAAPSRTGRAPYPARRRSHSDAKRGGTVGSPIHQLLSFSGASPCATAVRQAAPKAPRAAAGLGVMLRHSFGDGSPLSGVLHCCIGGESPPLVSSFPFFLFF